MTRRALITGITGQDGSYLAELLLAKGYEVHGLRRRSSTFNSLRIEHLYQDPRDPDTRLFLHYADLTDESRLIRLLRRIQPDEVYNLAGQSHVGVSFDEPEYTGDTVGLGAVRLLEAIRTAELDCRYYQASSSAMYGTAPAPQREDTAFRPTSPYGAAKLYAHNATTIYREGRRSSSRTATARSASRARARSPSPASPSEASSGRRPVRRPVHPGLALVTE